MTIILNELEDSFDNDSAEEMLNLSVGSFTHTSDLIRKSIYDFDLQTPEGIEKLMALLPIMDPDILKDITTEIWTGYETDADPRRLRFEIKGFLKDYLDSYDQEKRKDQDDSKSAKVSDEEPSSEPDAAASEEADRSPAEPGSDEQT